MQVARILGLLPVVCAFSLATATQGAENSSLPLSSIFSGPDFQTQGMDNLQWHGGGTSFTYTRRDASSGFVDIYEQDVGSGKERLVLSARALTHEGRSIAMSGYQWSSDRRILLVFGPKNRTWDSVIEAPHYIYDSTDGSIMALAGGNPTLRNVSLAPDGRHVGYVLDNNLYVTSIQSGETVAVTDDGSENVFNGIFDYGSTMFGFYSAWHWSPDASKIAFWRLDVSDVKVFWMIDELGKYNEVRPLKYANTAEKHAVNRIGVYDLSSGRTTWMDTGNDEDDYIPRIDWTRTSETLSIQRLNRTHKRLDLLLADTETGESTVIVSDTDPAWIDVTEDLMFFEKGDKFVWTSEKSGYRHAYLYDYDGEEKQLTDGNWEIASLIAVDERAGWLYFYAKKDSFIDQHVYRVRLTGSAVERLSTESGWHVWNMSPDARHVIEEYSTAAMPPTYALRRPGGAVERVLLSNELEGLTKYAVPNPEFTQFTTSDGKVLNAYFIKPTDFDPGRKYPVIAYGYGNAGSQMVVNRWGSSRGAQRDLWHRYMAGQGYVIFCMDNRTTAGRGKRAKNLIYGHYAKWAVLDQLQGVEYLKSLPFVDSKRMGFWGWSGGGYLTAAMMTKGAPHYKVGVSVAPVIDLTRYQAVGVERWMGQLHENQAGYDAVNLINFVDRLEGDLLLIHGTGDENVKFAFTLQFADALIEANKQFDMMVYPNEHHGIEGARLHVYTKIADYFKEKL